MGDRNKNGVEESKDGNNKKGKGAFMGAAMGVIMAVFTLFLPIILIAAFLLTIINGIIEIVRGVIDGLINFLRDPIAWVTSATKAIGNGVSYFFNGEHWEPEASSCTFTYILTEDQMEAIKEQVTAEAIDLEKASLTDEVIKKMILVNYMTMSTEDTEIAIPISKEDFDKRHSTSNAFKYKVGDENWRSKRSVLYVCKWNSKNSG